MPSANIITLTTDFGLKDPFVGQIKGTILSRNPDACIIDITHAIDAHNVLTAAITIQTSYDYFPPGSVHLAIVDPGVGSQRKILAAAVHNHIFIAPDNGLLFPLLKESDNPIIHRVNNTSLLPSKISSTFHGRDIMAPVAAAIAAGMPLAEVGPAEDVDSCVCLIIPQPIISEHKIEGEILRVDRFGNIRTNITKAHLSKSLCQSASFNGICIKQYRVDSISNTYADADQGTLVAVIDSGGYLEIAVNKGDAAWFTRADIGDPITVLMNGTA